METTTELERLLDQLATAKRECAEADQRRHAIEEAVLDERFRDWDLFAVGDIVLVPRKLFGKTKMWPAKISAVHREYREGHYPDTYQDDPGGYWDSQIASYTVFYKQADGSFGGSSNGVYHGNVEADPDTEVEA